MPYFALIIMYYHVKIACYQSATTPTTLCKSKTVIIHSVDATASLYTSSTSDCTGIRSDPQSDLATNGENDADEFARKGNTGLCQDESLTND